MFTLTIILGVISIAFSVKSIIGAIKGQREMNASMKKVEDITKRTESILRRL